MNTPLIRRADGYPPPATWRGVGAQAAAALGMLTGLWVAVSPSVHHPAVRRRQRRRRTNLISGLAVAAVGAFALAGPRGFAGLQSGSALLGVWLIIAGPHPQPQAPHRRLDVLVQRLGRRGADRPGRRQPGRRRPAAAGPPLTARTVRVLTGGQDPHPGPPDALAP